MGKKTRPRKGGRQKRQQQAVGGVGGGDGNNKSKNGNTSSSSSSATTGGLLQRLRHADSQTRQAALSVLLHNNSTLLLCSGHGGHGNGNINSDQQQHHRRRRLLLLEAVRERLMDENVECAIAAAECLGNFLSSTATTVAVSSSTSTTDADYDVTTAAWLPLFLRRCSTCIPENNNNKMDNELTKRCLECICSLIETNAIVTERLAANRDLRHSLVTVLVPWLSLAATATPSKSRESGGTDNDNDIDVSIVTLCARCLHSVWDDNPTLLHAWFSTPSSSAASASASSNENDNDNHKLLMALSQMIQCDDNNNHDDNVPSTASLLTVTAQLHAVGAWMAVWFAFGSTSASSSSGGDSKGSKNKQQQKQQQFLVEAVANNAETLRCAVRVLSQTLQTQSRFFSLLPAQALQVQRAYTAFAAQQQDAALERKVLQAQSAKNEPARLIARRLQVQRNKQEQDLQQDMEEEEEEEDMKDNDNIVDTTTSPKLETEQLKVDNINDDDCKQVLQEQEDAWTNLVRPLQLALEITANLTTATAAATSTLDDDDDESYDSENVVMTEAAEAVVLDERLSQLLVQYHLAPSIHALLCALTASDWWCSEAAAAANNHEVMAHDTKTTTSAAASALSSTTLPAPIVTSSDLDLLSKAATCLGHCLAISAGDNTMSHPPSLWEQPPKSLWMDLKQAHERLIMMQEQCCRRRDNNVAAGELEEETTAAEAETTAAASSISGAMVVALQSQSWIRTQVGPEDLDFLICMVSGGGNNNNNSIVVRDGVCMLGILCSQEKHSVAVNEKVCRALQKAGECSTNTSNNNKNNHTSPSSASSSSSSSSTTTNMMVVSEVLSALMDIYGQDDCHPAVFLSLRVLSYFERTVPTLERLIANSRKMGMRRDFDNNNDEDGSADNVEQWKETVWNAKRFIEYKKG